MGDGALGGGVCPPCDGTTGGDGFVGTPPSISMLRDRFCPDMVGGTHDCRLTDMRSSSVLGDWINSASTKITLAMGHCQCKAILNWKECRNCAGLEQSWPKDSVRSMHIPFHVLMKLPLVTCNGCAAGSSTLSKLWNSLRDVFSCKISVPTESDAYPLSSSYHLGPMTHKFVG